MKDQLTKIAGDVTGQIVSRTPVSTLKGFLRTWLISAMLVAVPIAIGVFWSDWAQIAAHPVMLVPVVMVYGIAVFWALIPCLVILAVSWILFS